MADKYHSIHTGQAIDSAITKALNPSTTFNSEDAGKLADAKAVGELVTAEKDRAEATYLPYDGYSQLARVGEADVADNLTPFSGDSGTSQNTPFILQGSGCANGEEQADTGSYCQLKEKRGNTVVVNQQWSEAKIPSDSALYSASTYTANGVTFTKNGDGSITIQTDAGGATEKVEVKIATGGTLPLSQKHLIRGAFGGSASTYHIEYASRIITDGSIYDAYAYGYNMWITVESGAVITTPKKIYPQIIFLPLWFGSNDAIPTHLLNHPEDFFRYYQGDLSYNVGALTDCNGRYLKTTGRNVCDEVFEGGSISKSNGSDVPNTEGFRTKNYQRVVPNTPYHLHSGIEISGYYVHEYDSSKNYLKSTSIYENNQVIILSPNTIFVRLSFWKSESDWGSNVPAKDVAQIVLSLYYEGESGYDQYYPYEELANIDTGDEVLRSAGSAYDLKVPDGTITRNIGSVDMGSLTWSAGVFQDVDYFLTQLTGAKAPIIGNYANIVCSKYTNIAVRGVNYMSDKTMFLWTNGTSLYVCDDSYTDAATFKAAMSGVYLEYELADSAKTTEQGTPFPENVAIDDFGTMAFDCPNGVPQGNTVFYPVDYKAEFDTLHNITDGDMHKIALKGELAPTDPDTIKGVVDYTSAVLSGCGGTLRQVLCLKETLDFDNTNYADLGSLNWSAGSTNQTGIVRWTGSLADAKNSGKCICSNYKSITAIDTYKCVDGCALNSNGNQVTIYDSNYNTIADITDFVASLKGQVIAYEKATT